MPYAQCPKCGGGLAIEKDSSSGRVMRDYYCPKCQWSDFEEEGPALWQVLSDDREEQEARRKEKEKPKPFSWLGFWRRWF